MCGYSITWIAALRTSCSFSERRRADLVLTDGAHQLDGFHLEPNRPRFVLARERDHAPGAASTSIPHGSVSFTTVSASPRVSFTTVTRISRSQPLA